MVSNYGFNTKNEIVIFNYGFNTKNNIVVFNYDFSIKIKPYFLIMVLHLFIFVILSPSPIRYI